MLQLITFGAANVGQTGAPQMWCGAVEIVFECFWRTWRSVYKSQVRIFMVSRKILAYSHNITPPQCHNISNWMKCKKGCSSRAQPM